MTINVYNIAEDCAKEIMCGYRRECWAESDLYDMAWIHANSSQYTMWADNAHDFVKALPRNIATQAEEDAWEFSDCESISYDKLAREISKYALVELILEAVAEHYADRVVSDKYATEQGSE